MLRSAILLVALGAALPAYAEPMNAEAARRFVVGKLFDFTCFEGTRGSGRVMSDGSVAGQIQFQGKGPLRNAALPADTLQVKGGNVCAQVKGMPFKPCFNLERKDHRTFRGSISGLGFASCEFVRRAGRINVVRASAGEPLSLRSSLSAQNP